MDYHICTMPGNCVGIGPPKNPPWLVVGPGLPADGEAGFPPGAIFLRPSLVGAEIYINVGSATSCDFNAAFDPVTLLKRLTTAQRDAIVSPTEGMLIYNLTTHKLNVRVAAAWEAVTSE